MNTANFDEPKEPEMRDVGDALDPMDIIEMPLARFKELFGFRPVDALEKHYFAATGKRIDALSREAINEGVLGDVDLSHVIME
jgi:hypothetical protein